MGSATREALAQSVKALESSSDSVDLTTAASLLDAARILGESAQLRTLLADPAVDRETKSKAIGRVFGTQLGDSATSLLTTIVEKRWSTAGDLLDGVEEVGIRAVAISAPDAPIESELFQFGRVVNGNAELELALSAKLADPARKAGLVNRLLTGKVSEATVVIVSHLIGQSRGRRIGKLLSEASAIVADQRGRIVATVTSATPLDDAQLDRLGEKIKAIYGREAAFNVVVDPSLVGGVRIQAGDDVIDASIAARLGDLKLKLAG